MEILQLLTRQVIGYEGRYLIEPTGRLFSIQGLELEECLPDKQGYVKLTKNGNTIQYPLGALVMKHYVTDYKTYLPVHQVKPGLDYSVSNLTQNKPF